MVFEDWLLSEEGFKRVHGVTQLLIKRNLNKNIKIIITKITDDVLMTGSAEEMKRFADSLQTRFEVSKIVIDSDIAFNGAIISRTTEETFECQWNHFYTPYMESKLANIVNKILEKRRRSKR